jgi:predicted DNA-binding transcriptional regulator YafY
MTQEMMIDYTDRDGNRMFRTVTPRFLRWHGLAEKWAMVAIEVGITRNFALDRIHAFHPVPEVPSPLEKDDGDIQ